MTHDRIPSETWEGQPCEHWRSLWAVPGLLLFRTVSSTNDVARELAEAGAPEGTAVLADHQTAGRGRGGRRWHAPPGRAILLSIVLRPARFGAEEVAPGVLPLLVGLAVARAIGRIARIRAGIKWPNDVLLPDGGKVAGILCEGALTGGSGGYVVAGIGINVCQTADELPAEPGAEATSLLLATGRRVSRSALAGRVIAEVRRIAAHGARPLDAGLLAGIRRRDVLRGRAVTVDGRDRGTVQGIAADGSLLLRDPGGRVVAIRSGTIRVVAEGESIGGSRRP
ncbi:MAG TPA: biotin--[acetyl-CoA-carboxylase] ligase [Longimicrobiales bacterium]